LDEFEPVGSLAIVAHGVVSKTILQHFLGLDEAQTIAVQHPNSLLYRLTLDATGVEVTHFIAQDDGALQVLDLQHSAQPIDGIFGHEGADVNHHVTSAAMQSE
jgi:broad specificity phosphatase PhoE